MSNIAELPTRKSRLRALEPLLDPALDLARAPHWEGELEGNHGAPKGSTIRVKAQIGFDGSLIEGVGRAVNFPADATPELALSGTRESDAVCVQVWFNGEPFGHQPFVCSGELTSDGREMAGDWSVACQNPDTCGCKGGGGRFRLKRIG